MEEKLNIPEGITVSIDKFKVSVSGPKGKNDKDYSHIHDMSIKKEGNQIIVSSTKKGRNSKRDVYTLISHIKNQFTGVIDGYKINMQEAHTHFPIKMEVKGNKIYLSSFTGEKKPRVADVIGNVKVEVKGANLTISGTDKEAVSQTAANIRQVTKVIRLDNRVFQDGVYILEE